MAGDIANWSSCPADTTPLVRTDFSSDVRWSRLVAAVTTPSPEGFLAILHLIDDPLFRGADPYILCRDPALTWDASLLIVADNKTMTHDEMPLLCLDTQQQKALRTVPSELWSIENNVRLANVDLNDFVGSADDDGIYRGSK